MNKINTPLISVIVPVYNTEKYLRKCIESIQEQTLSDIEIILVDDGSTDSSLSICESYKANDCRIVIIHKENGGLSSARNSGLDRAKSLYVGFVDSDDYIDKDMFYQLYHSLVEFAADISTCGVYDVFGHKTIVKTHKNERYVLDRISACEMVLKQKLNATIMPNKLFRKDLFEGLRFPVGKVMEDDFICTKLFLRSNRVAVLTTPYYYYIHRPQSITTTRFRISDLDPIEAYDYNFELVKEAYPVLIETMNARKCWARFYTLDKLYRSQEEQSYPKLEKELLQYLKDRKRLILFGDFFSIIKKAGFLLLLIHPVLYKYFLCKRRGHL